MANPKDAAKSKIDAFVSAVKDMLPKNAILNVGIRTAVNRKKVKAAQADGMADADAYKAGTTYNPLVRISLPVPAKIKAAVEEFIGGGMNESTDVMEILDTITVGGKTNKVEIKYL